VVSNLAASVGALSWMLTEMITKRTKKMSLNGFCCGAVSGLVAITPASGFVSPVYAVVIGFSGLFIFVSIIVSNFFVIVYFYNSWNRLLFCLLFEKDNKL
jgi:ammonia channel protein AmtB